ncbi:MAG: hypothetical protein JXR48_18335 [Candidatus Delongbacteria bacterium]|nr:hypothetical protein [Candidatus Delongbacteria bacterium]MBN2836919.1 hypothetical protein [Candidatus Delongbacteria bacterium]
MKLLNILSFLFSILLLIACSENKNYSVEEKNGITILKNKNKPAKPNLTAKLSKKFTINSLSEDSLQNFTNIHTVTCDKYGNIYLLDKDKVSVKKYDNQGNFLTAFASRGSGPGELNRPSSICIKGDTVLINDLNTQMTSKFSSSGIFIKNIPYTSNVPRKIQPIDDKRYANIQFSYQNDPDGLKILGSLVISDDQFSDDLKIWENFAPYGNTTDLHEFYPEFHVGKNKIYIADNSRDKYQIFVYDFNGTKLKEIRKDYIRIKMDTKDLETLKSNFKKSNPYLDSVRVEVTNKFALLDIELDKDENIWIKPSLDERDIDKYGKAFDIFDKEGIFQNRIYLEEIPSNSRINFYGDILIVTDVDGLKVDVYDYRLIST